MKEMENKMKGCINCKYYKSDYPQYTFAICIHKEAITKDEGNYLVGTYNRYLRYSDMRENENKCGKKARYFEEKVIENTIWKKLKNLFRKKKYTLTPLEKELLKLRIEEPEL